MRIVPRISRQAREERGQVLALAAVGMIALVGMVGFVVDVGRVYAAHRQLQAAADAAALAGAAELPDVSAATTAATSYTASAGKKNYSASLGAVTTTISTKCVTGMTCNPANTIVVQQNVSIPSTFARVFGMSSFDISAKATATMNGGKPEPLDVMIVLDRTGSMCQPCSKITNARNGIYEFLGAMNPTVDHIGLAILAPASSVANRCGTASSSLYDTSTNPYTVVPLSSDYRSSATGPLNYSSNLVSTVGCVDTGGITSYATAIEQAQDELDLHGRPDAADVIIFFTDGEANYGPWYYGNSSNYRRQPCHQAISSAGAIKASGTTVYTIAYDTPSTVRCQGYKSSPSSCRANAAEQFSCDEAPVITAYSTLQQMATDNTKFFYQPNPGDLTAVFQQVADDLSGIRLQDDDYTGA